MRNDPSPRRAGKPKDVLDRVPRTTSQQASPLAPANYDPTLDGVHRHLYGPGEVRIDKPLPATPGEELYSGFPAKPGLTPFPFLAAPLRWPAGRRAPAPRPLSSGDSVTGMPRLRDRAAGAGFGRDPVFGDASFFVVAERRLDRLAPDGTIATNPCSGTSCC